MLTRKRDDVLVELQQVPERVGLDAAQQDAKHTHATTEAAQQAHQAARRRVMELQADRSLEGRVALAGARETEDAAQAAVTDAEQGELAAKRKLATAKAAALEEYKKLGRQAMRRLMEQAAPVFAEAVRINIEMGELQVTLNDLMGGIWTRQTSIPDGIMMGLTASHLEHWQQRRDSLKG